MKQQKNGWILPIIMWFSEMPNFILIPFQRTYTRKYAANHSFDLTGVIEALIVKALPYQLVLAVGQFNR